MKKLLVTLSVGVLATASLLAQGRVNFSNSSATPILVTSSYYGAPGGPNAFHPGPTNVVGTASTANFGIGPASVRIQLFAGLTSSSLSPVLIGTGANQTVVSNTASTVAGLQGTFNGGSNLPLHGYDGSVPVFLQFTAFSINGAYGRLSPVIQVNLATGSALATQLFSATPTANQWDGILIGFPELVPAPEPSALALLGLGASALYFARRRQ